MLSEASSSLGIDTHHPINGETSSYRRIFISIILPVDLHYLHPTNGSSLSLLMDHPRYPNNGSSSIFYQWIINITVPMNLHLHQHYPTNKLLLSYQWIYQYPINGSLSSSYQWIIIIKLPMDLRHPIDGASSSLSY